MTNHRRGYGDGENLGRHRVSSEMYAKMFSRRESINAEMDRWLFRSSALEMDVEGEWP